MFSLGSGVTPNPNSGDDKYKKIKEIIQPYIDLARSQPIQNIGIPAHFLRGVLKDVLNPDEQPNKYDKIPVLTISGFVNLANASLQSNTNFTLPYIESIYKMAGMEHSCNGIIVIKYTAINENKEYEYKTSNPEVKREFKPYFYFNLKDEGEKIYIPINTSIDKKMYVLKKSKQPTKRKTDDSTQYQNYLKTKFTDKFLAQYNNINCKFISIAVNLLPTEGGHANMLLVYKGVSEVYIMLYEPHGAQGVQSSEGPQQQYKTMKTHFINFMKELIISKETQSVKKRTVKIVDPKKISEPQGIQSYMKDRNGYCYMISSFWLYIILMLTKTTGQEFNDKLFENLNIIEGYLYGIAAEEIKKDKPKPEVIPSQPVTLTLAKQGSLHNYTADQVLYSIIVHFSYDFLTKYYMHYFTPGLTPDLYSVFIPIYREKYKDMNVKRPEKFKKLLLGYIENTGTDVSPSEKLEIETKANEISKRVTDGLSCKNDKDCLSNKCQGDICVCRTYIATQSQGKEDDGSSQESSVQHTTENFISSKTGDGNKPCQSGPIENEVPDINEVFEVEEEVGYEPKPELETYEVETYKLQDQDDAYQHPPKRHNSEK